MKKILFILSITMFLFSCEKEIEDCNCGVISNDGIDGDCYWLEIRNNCSNNKKVFCFDEDFWMNNYVGDNVCVTNESGW